MDTATLSVNDVCYIIFGCVGLLTACVTLYNSQRKMTGDERERLVRIDEGVKQLREEVASLKVEMRSANDRLNNHEQRITKLEMIAEHEPET